MIPLRDENPTLHHSIMTFCLIGFNLIAWGLVQGFGFEPALSRSVNTLGLIPSRLLDQNLFRGEPSANQIIAAIIHGLPAMKTLLTSMFLHGGWFHLIGNMWFLFVFGDNVEDIMGAGKFLAFYLLCGLFAGIAQISINPASPYPMVGASGAISGVLGAYAVLYPRAPVHLLVFLGFYITRIAIPAFLMLGYWFFIQLIGMVPSLAKTGASGGGIAFLAHIGGFIAGIVLVFFFRDGERVRQRRSLMKKLHRQ
ncbi:MAG: rhomboid family intramembrane serine protease [Chitinivibrionales bacterium]|nr:rhomboid family intramembrane serine protease [Chitinivibrionales bacterium]